jgi:hypothetical protein
MALGIRNFPSGDTAVIKSQTNSDGSFTPHRISVNPGTAAYGVIKITTAGVKSLLIAAPAASPDLGQTTAYLKSIQVANKGGTAALISLYDGSATSPDVAIGFIYVPASTTVPVVYDIAIHATAGNAIYAMADAVSTIYLTAQGYWA